MMHATVGACSSVIVTGTLIEVEPVTRRRLTTKGDAMR